MNFVYKTIQIQTSIFIILAFLFTDSSAQYQVTGVLLDPDQTPLSSISVKLLNDADELLADDQTDSQGRFSLAYQLDHTSADPQNEPERPSGFKLGSSYPNPFNPRSTVPFYAPENTRAIISVHNILGQSVLSAHADISAGNNDIIVNLGGHLSQGQYILRVQGEGYSLTESMTFLSAGIRSGNPEIRVQTGAQLPARMESIENLTASIGDLRVVVEATEQFLGMEVTVAPGQDVELGSLILPLRSPEVCDDLNLLASSSMPAHMIELGGFSEELGEAPIGWLYDADFYNEYVVDGNGADSAPEDTLRHPVYIEQGEHEGLANVLVPVHPVNYMGGGDAKLVIISEDEMVVCPALPLQIEPLPAAPGTLEGMLADMNGALEAVALDYGENPDVLRAQSVYDFDPHLWHVAAGLQMLNGPNNPNNLMNILQGSAPLSNEEAPDEEVLDVVNALLAVTGIAEKFSTFSSDLQSNNIAFKSAVLKIQSDSDTPPEIVTPDELDALMSTQEYIASMNEGLSSEIRELTGILMGSVAVTTGAIGAVPVAAACGASALAASLMQLVIDIAESSLPSELQALELNASHTVFNEDNSDIGAWDATLEAKNNGWTLSAPTAIGLVPGMGRVTSILTSNRFIQQGTREVTDYIVSITQTHLMAIWDEPSGPVNIESQTWLAPVDVDRDDDYFSWELQTHSSELGDDPIMFVDDDESRYYANSVGTALLRIRTSTDRFQGQFRESIEELAVLPIQIELARWPIGGIQFYPREEPFYIRTDDEMDIGAIVSGADDQSVSWEVFDDGILTELGSNTNVRYTPPDEPGTHLLIARSTTTGGARDHSAAPERVALARIYVIQDELIVYPDLTCLETADTHQFKAVFGGEMVDISDLEWEITGSGSMLSGGVFMPVSEGDVTITFYHPDEPDDIQEISFTVSDLCSYMRLHSVFFDHRSDCVSYIEPIHDADGNPAYGMISNSFDDPFFFSFNIFGSVLQKSGAWSAQIPFAANDSDTDASFWIAAGIQEDGSMFPELPRWSVSDRIEMAGWPLDAERKVRTVDGQELQAWYGSFVLPIMDFDYYVQTEEFRETVVYGEFSGVLPGQFGCF